MISQAKVLAFWFFGGAQTQPRRFGAGVGLGELPEGKDQPLQHRLGQVVEEIALVFARIQAPQQLRAAAIRIGPQTGVVAGGHAGDAPFFLSPIEHRAKFHRPVAARARQRRDAIAIALHQKLHDLLLKGVARIHHMVRNLKLLTKPGRIHQPLRAASPFAAHQPERQPFHFPVGITQQRRGERAIHTARETHGNAMLPRPGLQALNHGGHRRSRLRRQRGHSLILPSILKA